jgi:GTPase Era involved in 16S rRNA processing
MITVREVFKTQKDKALIIQNKLLDFLSQGELAGVQIDPSLKKKLYHSITEGNKLKVALIGGFSEGKTSIAAAWLGKHKSEMLISHQESSNSVTVYEIDDDLILVDTPGLFGYKEKFNSDIGEQENYKDITRKYVSEAHLILYVMSPTNPLKESHKNELNWLFRDLNLLPRTVFVLSRFDEVADIADDDDYEINFQIKKDNVVSRLKDLINLKDGETQHMSIVAVSANPFDSGFEYWMTDPERFKKLSRIPFLQQVTAKKIEESGGLEKLALETSKSIIKDVLLREIPVAIEKYENLAEQTEKLTVNKERAEKELLSLSKKISASQVSLKDFIIDHFVDLILQLKGCSIETISEFFEREIGDEGIVLDTKIQNAFSRNIDAVTSDLVRIQSSLNSDISAFNAHLVAMGRQGLDWMVKGNIINASTIKSTRDLLWSSLKFKPWGAVNLAKGLNGALLFFGLALEAWDSWKETERTKQFEISKKSLIENLEGQRKELLEKINSTDFPTKFFPGFLNIQTQIEKLLLELEKTENQKIVFEKWRNEAEIIDAEFEILEN